MPLSIPQGKCVGVCMRVCGCVFANGTPLQISSVEGWSQYRGVESSIGGWSPIQRGGAQCTCHYLWLQQCTWALLTSTTLSWLVCLMFGTPVKYNLPLCV